MWQSQVSDMSKGYFEAVTVMNSGSPECRGGYPIPKATPNRGLDRVKSQPKLESRFFNTLFSLIPLRGYFLIPKQQAVIILSSPNGTHS